MHRVYQKINIVCIVIRKAITLFAVVLEVLSEMPLLFFWIRVIEKRADRIWIVTEVTVQSEVEKPVQLISIVARILPAEATRLCLECVGINLQPISFDLKMKNDLSSQKDKKG